MFWQEPEDLSPSLITPENPNQGFTGVTGVFGARDRSNNVRPRFFFGGGALGSKLKCCASWQSKQQNFVAIGCSRPTQQTLSYSLLWSLVVTCFGETVCVPLPAAPGGKCLSLPPEEAGVRTGCFSRGRCHGGQMSGHVFHTVIARHRHVYSTARPPDAVLIVFWSADPLWTVLCSASVSSAYHFRDILRLCQEWWSAGCLATRNYSGNFIFITNDRLQLCSMIPLQ